MTRAEAHLSCARAQALLEAYLDGELSSGRAGRLELHLRGCAGCREELAAAGAIHAGLRSLPRWSCPGVVVREVFARIEAEARRRNRFGERIAAVAFWAGRAPWRPALAGTSVAALGLGIWLLSRPPVPSAPAEDLVRAEREARWALAYVAEWSGPAAMQSVIGEVVGDVIGRQVIAPVTEAVRRPLLEEEKL
jgi:anti-sigma factor RsiW